VPGQDAKAFGRQGQIVQLKIDFDLDNQPQRTSKPDPVLFHLVAVGTAQDLHKVTRRSRRPLLLPPTIMLPYLVLTFALISSIPVAQSALDAPKITLVSRRIDRAQRRLSKRAFGPSNVPLKDYFNVTDLQ
jgi:hypothetical protein